MASKLLKSIAAVGVMAAAVLTPFSLAATGVQTTTDDDPNLPAKVSAASWNLVLGGAPEAEEAAAFLDKRGGKDVLATVILAMRYNAPALHTAIALFNNLSGAQAGDWFDAQLYLENNPQIVPHESYRGVKLFVLSRIDPNFIQFLGGERSNPEKMGVRLEEIVWGGVRADGIPPLDDPKLIKAGEADYLLDDDEVFGVKINGDARAYPLRIMGWHEMFNETIGGVPVALAYCTLCGAGILYETAIDGHKTPFRFGSSGLLYRSNKLMFDRHTFSLWNQFTGKPVNGPLLNSGIELRVRPVAVTSWAKWKKKNPDTKVLSLETGHSRDYGSGAVYRDYFASPDLMFPAAVRNETVVKRKDYVFGMRSGDAKKAWPLRLFKGGNVINDTFGDDAVVLIGDEETRTVRAYFSGGKSFGKGPGGGAVKGPGGGLWEITEEAIVGPKGEKLKRAPGAVSYWFAFENHYGENAELAGAPG